MTKLMYESKKFDEIVSLGYNCEISFRIENCLGTLNSYPFSWSYILDRDLFLSALDHLDEIFNNEVSVCRDSRVNSMIQCDKYKICFHPRSEYVSADGAILPEGLDKAVTELRSRIAHLIHKFNALLADPKKRTLFLVGITGNGQTTDYDFIKNLHSVLERKYLSGNFVLVAVVPRKRFSKELIDLETDTLKVRKIKKFGKQRCNDISTDGNGWAKIFREFLGEEREKEFRADLSKHRRERIIAAIRKRLRLKK